MLTFIFRCCNCILMHYGKSYSNFLIFLFITFFSYISKTYIIYTFITLKNKGILQKRYVKDIKIFMKKENEKEQWYGHKREENLPES